MPILNFKDNNSISSSSYQNSPQVHDSGNSVAKSYKSNLSVFDVEKGEHTYNSPVNKLEDGNVKFDLKGKVSYYCVIYTN